MTAVRLMPVVPALLVAFAAVAEPSPFALVPYPRRCVQTRSVYAATTNDVDGLPVVRKTDATLPPEGYRLSVTLRDITVWSSDEAGAFYAVQTLRQLSREKPANAAVRENLLASLGEGRWGDDVERAFFNAGPGCVSRDFLRHVYFQMPNRTGEKGEAAMLMFNDDGFVTIERVWQVGDRVTLSFPMRPRTEDFCDMNDNGRLRRSVVLGPLLFAYNPPERDDNTPVDPIVEPLLPKDLGPDGIAVERTAMPPVWGWQPDAPVRLSLTAADGKPLALVPYGCTKLRISAFGVK